MKEKKRVPSFFPLYLNAHMPDDTMPKYGAYWTKLSVQKNLPKTLKDLKLMSGATNPRQSL